MVQADSSAHMKGEVKTPTPSAKSFVTTKDEAQKGVQFVDIPIDEVKAINLKVSPTYNRDFVESVTLKSFRKIIGYDTFNSILQGNRHEAKDQADYYNVTVSMMVKRVPEATAARPQNDVYNGGKTLS